MTIPLNPFQRRLRTLKWRNLGPTPNHPAPPDPISELIYAASHSQHLTPSDHRARLLSDLIRFPEPLTLPFSDHLLTYVFHDVSISEWCHQNSISYTVTPNPKFHPATLLTLHYHPPVSLLDDFEL